MNSKTAKRIRRELRDAGFQLNDREYVYDRNAFRNAPLTGRRLYQDAKRILKAGRGEPLQGDGDTAD